MSAPRFAAIAAALLLAACGGGGGGTGAGPAPPAPSNPIVPTSGPSPSAAPSATAVPASAISVASVPAGLPVSVNGTPLGVTPLVTAPPFASNSLTFSVGSGASAYAVTLTQRGVAASILYNQQADTRGTLATISPTAVVRRTQAVPVDASVRRVLAGGERPLAGRRVVVTDAAGRRSVVAVPAGEDAVAYASQLRTRAGVTSAVPTHLRYPSAATVLPNDTHFDAYTQWPLFQINMPTAWGYTTAASAVPIAVIDTGIDATHPDLAGKVTYGERIVNGIVTPGVAAASDTNGHGTLVAGIAAAATNNAAGFAGAGWSAPLQAYRVFADGATSADSADEAKAVDDAVAHGAKIVLIALGASPSGGVDVLERDAIARAVAAGVTVVAPAGNAHANAVDFPAGYDGVIAVGASALDDSARPGSAVGAREYVASYSNTGPGLAVVAPGGDPSPAEIAAASGNADLLHWIVNLGTTTPASGAPRCASAADCYVLGYGTSLAAAHVAGGIAIMLAQNATIAPQRIAAILSATARNLGDPAQGAGRVDFGRALAALAGDAAAPAPVKTNFVAFAYVPGANNAPRILDVTYPRGVPVAADGTFRVADVPANAPPYSIGVWYDANGNGVVDAGDYFGSVGGCTTNAPCAGAANITVSPVAAGFVLK